MSNWKDMAKRLRENQKRNLGDFEKQASISEERKKDIEQIAKTERKYYQVQERTEGLK